MLTLVDFETRSDLSLPKVGAYKYATHPSTKIICLGYKTLDSIDDNNQAFIWLPNKSIQDIPFPFYAHNAQFDYYIWKYIMVPRYGAKPATIENWIDVQALCQMFTFPGALDKVAKLLKTKSQKDRTGKALLTKASKSYDKMNLDDWRRLYAYCKDDIHTMHDIIRALPLDQLPQKEQKIWEITAKYNERGLPIDTDSLTIIREAIASDKEWVNEVLANRTQDLITSIKQTKAIQRYINKICKIPLPNLQEGTLLQYLANPTPFHPDVRDIVEWRLDFGASAASKFEKMHQLLIDRRVHDYIKYHAASTGRWGGAGLQIQNFYRKSSKNYDKDLKALADTGKKSKLAKTLLRGTIKASPGHVLMGADYSAIEYVFAIWLVDDFEHINAFVDGISQYKQMAAALYNVAVNEVDSEQRQFGKVVVLQAQYQAGAIGLRKSAKSWGLNMNLKTSDHFIKTYRKVYNKIVSAWYDLKDTAINALESPGTAIYQYGCKFQYISDRTGRRWLTLRLPSGRYIYYCQPNVKEKRITIPIVENGVEKEKKIWSKVISYWGLDSYTHQWCKLTLSPGTLFNNIIQGSCSDVLREATLKLEKIVPDCTLASVHDEFIFEIPVAIATPSIKKIHSAMTCSPKWANTLPLRISSWSGERYRK